MLNHRNVPFGDTQILLTESNYPRDRTEPDKGNLIMVSLSSLSRNLSMGESDITHKFYSVMGPASMIYRYNGPNGELLDGITVEDAIGLLIALCPVEPAARRVIRDVLQCSFEFDQS